VAAAVNSVAFREADPTRTALNAGLGFSYSPEHAVLARHAIAKRKLKPRRIYYGFFDGQLFSGYHGGWSDLVGNRAMAYYADPALSIKLYTNEDDFIARWQMRLIGKIPLLVDRYALWAKVELLRRRLSGVGFPKADTNMFGRADDFRQLEAQDETRFHHTCEQIVETRQPLDAAVQLILDDAKRSGAIAIFVEMPMPTSHRSRFYNDRAWANLRDHTRRLLESQGAELVVASDWLPDDAFADALHLNKKGAVAFSRRIAGADTKHP
jgi:hypothetical protein